MIAASRSFHSAFKVRPEDTQGRQLYTLGDGQWEIPKLRVLLEKILPEQGVMEGFEVALRPRRLIGSLRPICLSSRLATRMLKACQRLALWARDALLSAKLRPAPRGTFGEFRSTVALSGIVGGETQLSTALRHHSPYSHSPRSFCVDLRKAPWADGPSVMRQQPTSPV